MAALALQNLVKIYPGDVRAVDDLSLDVADGELVVLVGPSGCGKTTALRMIAGLEQATAGTIHIDGRSMTGVPPKQRDVAMVFQGQVLYPHLSVAGNMAFGLKLRRVAKAEIRRRVDEAADVLGIRKLLTRRPGELSGGEQQRVALGRAIVRKPRLFLFDEPLSNLDAALRSQMRQEIRRIHARLATTTVYVTHDQTEAMTLGRRIAVIRQGRIQQVADPATLYNRPANRFVAGLIGSPAMNFFSGRIRRRDQRLVFEAESFSLPIPEMWTARLKPYTGKPITLGIRPEHIGSPTAEQTDDAPRIAAVVEAVEPVGPESYVYYRAAAQTFVSRAAAGHKLQIGDQVSPAVATDKLHFFDPQTEKATG
ncbi:MAG: ABC transporter ATP-binding protein [Planctomycetota bacterium]|jgi:multiple sugar transport system ATP-binding protein